MRYWNGGYISASRRAPAQSSASGIFNLRSQQVYKSAEKWPIGYDPGIIQSGLQSYLDAGDSSSYSGTGTNWYDLTSNNADAILTNGPSYSSSDGGYIDFDGSNDYAQISETNLNTNTLFSGSNNYSVSLWFNVDSFPSSTNYTVSPILLWGGVRSIFFTIGDGSPTNKLGWRGNISNTWQTPVLSNTLSLNTWYNICVTYDSSSGFVLYQNGSSVDTSTVTGNSANYSHLSVNGVQIGGHTRSGSRYFDGSVSSVLIYDKTLSSTEVTHNFNEFKGRYGL